MKQLALASILLLILGTGNFCSGQNADFIRGDCNTDGSTDFAMADMRALLAYFFQQGACVPCLDACDVDDDGVVNVNDAVLMLTLGTGCGPAYLPAPWPACGADPSTDSLGCVSYPCAAGPIPANPDFEFSASNITGNVNDIVSVDITLTIPAGESVSCWSYGLCHDPSLLSLVSVASAGSWTVDNEIHTLLSNGFFSEVSVGAPGFSGSINAGTHLIATAQYQILQAGNAPLNFCELIDGCSKPIAIWNGGTCQSFSPATTPGSAGTGVSCAIENPIIECGSATTSDEFTLTFDVVNNSGFDVTKLVIPGLIGGVSVSPNIIDVNLPNNDTLTGVQLVLNGGNAGDIVCIPVGLMATDDTGELFECCGTEVCVELPACCMDISDESITVNAANGDAEYTFTVTNLGGLTPTVAGHLFMSVVSPPGVAISNEWHDLGTLNDNDSITLSTIISGAQPGAEICFQITMHDATLNECCGIVHCITIPGGGTEPCVLVEGCTLGEDFDSDGVLDVEIFWNPAKAAVCCLEMTVFLDGVKYMSVDPNAGSAQILSSIDNLGSMSGTWCLHCFDPAVGEFVEQGCCVIPFAPPPPEFLRGDANSDGAFDISDVIGSLDYLFQGQSVPCLVALDSNDDETVDIGDTIFSLEALFGGGPSPWPPYQQCGVDETSGNLGCEYFPACEGNDSGPQGD